MTSLTLLRGASCVHPDGTITPADILIEKGRIASVSPPTSPPPAARIIDLTGLTVLPGFIDVHVHGGGGFSLITTRPDDILSYARWAASRGVTGFLATICAETVKHSVSSLRAASKLVGPIDGGATLLGLNLEGPFVSPERPGALPRAWLQSPDRHLFDELLEASDGALRVITIAPELPGAIEMIQAAQEAGVVVSVGHTDATFDQACAGFEAGATHVTHAFNAMRPLHHRDPGPLGAALQSAGVTIEVIADGVHLHPATVALLIRAFGPERVCLVTDAVAPAGLDSGGFRIGGREALMKDGAITLPDGTIAGSVATMDAGVRNTIVSGNADLGEASRMASRTPARLLGQESKGLIAPGCDADLIAVTPDFRIARTWVAGDLVHQVS